MDGEGREGIEVKEGLMNDFFAALSPLEATDFLAGEEIIEFEQAPGKSVVRVYNIGNTVLADISLLEKDDGWWASVVGKDDLFKFSSYKVANILLTPEEVFEENE